MNLPPVAPTAPVATILVVDDEERNVKLLEVLLQAEGYATVSALNGREALAAAVSACPDLILLDIMMPDMDGFETVAQLKADPRTRQVPVIMVTALDDRDTKQRALLAGAEEFLSKPITRTGAWRATAGAGGHRLHCGRQGAGPVDGG
ncbi:MAG: response regulator [Burkholderiaceae bacterium]|nr:response regulator [Burkholderiaceae bacterium]